MICVEAQDLLNNLKIPIRFGSLNPPFEEDRAILEMTVAELDTYMKKYAIEYFYRRIGVLKSKPKVAAPKRIRLSSAGSDSYECKCGAKSKEKPTQVLRESFSVACECRATFRINFPRGYYHTENEELNVAAHGEKMVRVTWSWRHNHDFDNPEFFMSLPLSKMAREALKEAVIKYGVTWSQVQEIQREERAKSNESRTWELMKVENRQIRYILGQISQNQPLTRHVPIVEEIGLSAIKDSSDVEECIAPQADEINGESYVIRQGPGNRPQGILQHCDRVQEPTQQSERELQQTSAILGSELKKLFSASYAFFTNLKSVEEKKKYTELVKSRLKIAVQEVNSPQAKQR